LKGSDFDWQAVRSRETPPAPREALALKFYGVTREYETSDFSYRSLSGQGRLNPPSAFWKRVGISSGTSDEHD